MAIELVTGKVWQRLRRARRGTRQSASVAVAYFGKGAAKLLDLRAGSRLVVDASENAVKSGQTCPADLLELHKKGVKIFNFPGLHAKVYVFGRTAAIGSANASQNSASFLHEAMVITTDPRTVNRSKEFVQSVAKDELGPKVLRNLAKLYRPPRLPGRPKQPRRHSRANPQTGSALPRIRIAHLSHVELSDSEERERIAGERVAKRRRGHRRTWEIDDFQQSGTHPYRRNDKIMMITQEDHNRFLVHSPGTVLHVRPYRLRHGKAASIHIELPVRRRKEMRAVARQLGRGWLKRLQHGGTLSLRRSAELYDFWQA